MNVHFKTRRKNKTLKRELTGLMILASACTLFSACIAVLYVFFSFFIQNTKEDITYVLNNTGQRFQAYMQFIEDGAVSVRHNSMLDHFFIADNEQATSFDELEPQLAYSMELFSERNMLDNQVPFVTSVYLFNNQNDCINKNYYRDTLAEEEKMKNYYSKLQYQFKKSQLQYQCSTDETSIHLFFRIYDDQMNEKGICIAVISREAVNGILNEASVYSNYTWTLVFGNSRVIASKGSWSDIEGLLNTNKEWSGLKELENKKVIGSASECGFNLRTILSVGDENIVKGLHSIIWVFAIGLFVVLLITIFVAFGASYRFTKPVSKMIESIRAFGKQDFDVRMEDSSIQEFQDIGNVFNEMADRIEYLIMQVYEKQLLATQSQMKYLQAQINPHFQFNILAMLSLKAKMAGNEEVYEGLRAFSKLTQGKIFREKEIKILVSEEMEIVNFYLYLQKSRFQDKLSYEITIDDERINQDLIPRLLIEPFVENAVSHGLEPKKDHGTVKIHLFETIETGDQLLHIVIEDDGVGFDTEEVESMEQEEFDEDTIQHTHTGLENTKRILQILYAEKQEFKISGGKGKGTKIEISIPVERGENYVENCSSR